MFHPTVVPSASHVAPRAKQLPRANKLRSIPLALSIAAISDRVDMGLVTDTNCPCAQPSHVDNYQRQ